MKTVENFQRSERGIRERHFHSLKLHDRAVLIHTGWDAHWRTEAYFEGHPFLTRDAADLLVKSGVVLVGIGFFAVPAKVRNFGTFPVRAFAIA